MWRAPKGGEDEGRAHPYRARGRMWWQLDKRGERVGQTPDASSTPRHAPRATFDFKSKLNSTEKLKFFEVDWYHHVQRPERCLVRRPPSLASSSCLPTVTVSLHLLSTSATGLLAALVSPSSSHPPPPLKDLHADLLHLLSLIYTNTTKLTLALHPPDLAPSYKAAIAPLSDLTSHLSTLVSNAISFHPRVHGRALSSEVQLAVKDVVVAVQELAQVHLALINVPDANSKGKGKGEEYMVKTATVHQLIERARSAGNEGISSSNSAAVRKSWKVQGDIIRDTMAELEDDGPEGMDDGFGDEGDEFDFSGADSVEEREFKKLVGHCLEAGSLHSLISCESYTRSYLVCCLYTTRSHIAFFHRIRQYIPRTLLSMSCSTPPPRSYMRLTTSS
jgi:hypothetical protein